MTDDPSDLSDEVIFKEGLAIMPDGSVMIKFHGRKPIFASREDIALGAIRLYELLEIAKHENLVDEATCEIYLATLQAMSAHYEREDAMKSEIAPRLR